MPALKQALPATVEFFVIDPAERVPQVAAALASDQGCAKVLAVAVIVVIRAPRVYVCQELLAQCAASVRLCKVNSWVFGDAGRWRAGLRARRA